MRVLMLGWEFPPHISGGLGTACQGIVNALGSMPDTKVIFVAPKVFGDEKARGTVFAGANKYVERHTTILKRKVRMVVPQNDSDNNQIAEVVDEIKTALADSKDKLIYIETASMLHPYMQAEQIERILVKKHINPDKVWFDADGKLVTKIKGKKKEIKLSYSDLQELEGKRQKFEFTGKYTSNLYTETGMFARVASQIAQNYDFDVIHAHDWLTYEAGVAIKKATGKPLVVHVHATEYDRSGGFVNDRVYNVEQHGMQEADAVVTVSNLTKDIVVKKYNIPEKKVKTVYNAVDFSPVKHEPKSKNDYRIVTFLGRITHQKGPEYFLKAAYYVLQKLSNVRFVMAGNGDMYHAMIREAARIGIADKLMFTDFLDRNEVRKLFAISDVFVMPSVSEPFGIVPLEAARSGVPVIISNQSGVSEILDFALKVDYWDVKALANAIYSIVKYPVLGKFLSQKGKDAVVNMKWDDCAQGLLHIYEELADTGYTAQDESIKQE